MSITEKICPSCGRTEKEVKFHGFICIEDFMATKKIKVPSSILVQICKYGDKMSINAWITKPADLIPQVSRLVKAKGMKVTNVDIDLRKKVAEVELSIDSEKIVKVIPLDVRKTLCDIHTRAVRGYYEAIVQVRATEELIQTEDKELIASKIQRMADRITGTIEAEYVKQEKVRGGLDLYTDSTAAVFKAFGDLGLRVQASRKLWTQKRGKQLFRTTFLVRV